MTLAIGMPHPRGKAHPTFKVLESLAWGELDAARARRALRHLRSCSACRRRLAWVQRLPTFLEGATRLQHGSGPETVLARRASGERIILPAAPDTGGRATRRDGPRGPAGPRP